MINYQVKNIVAHWLAYMCRNTKLWIQIVFLVFAKIGPLGFT